jgi:hypothetical protein
MPFLRFKALPCDPAVKPGVAAGTMYFAMQSTWPKNFCLTR